jgi:hypothetical protein
MVREHGLLRTVNPAMLPRHDNRRVPTIEEELDTGAPLQWPDPFTGGAAR